MANPGSFSLHSYDVDDITDELIQQAVEAFNAQLKVAWDYRTVNAVFTDDGAQEWNPADLDDYIGACNSSQYFKDVARAYEDGAKVILNATTEEESAKKLKEALSSTVTVAVAQIMNAIFAAKIVGESNRDSGVAPDGSDLPIEEQVSEDEDQAAINATSRASAEAAKAVAEEEKRAAAGAPGADSVSFKEQCFITSNIIEIIKYKYDTISKFKKLPYIPSTLQTNDFPSNASLLVHDDPFQFINKLLIYPDTEEYFNMRTEEIANLQPQIRFFKTVYDPDLKEEINTEIKFDTTFTGPGEYGTTGAPETADLASLLTNKKKRNAGTGIKQFDISFIGTDPFAAKKDLRGTLKIYTSSMEELFTVRGAHRGIPYRYIDLALKTITTNNSGGSKVNSAANEAANMTRAGTTTDDVTRLDFAIKAQIGIMPPTKTVASNASLLAAIGRNSVTVQMTPVTHEFNFQEDGSLEFVVHYVPFISDHFNTSMFDVFGGASTSVDDFFQKLRNKHFDDNCMAEEKEKARKEWIEARKEQNKKRLSNMINRLYRKQLIHYLVVPPAVVKAFNKEGPAADIKEVFRSKREAENSDNKTTKEIKQEADTKKAEEEARNIILKNTAGDPVSTNDNNIPFFYLHDIIDIAMENVEQTLQPDQLVGLEKMLEMESRFEADGGTSVSPVGAGDTDQLLDEYKKKYEEAYESYKKFRVILGPVEIVDPNNPLNVIVVSLGDIPISLKYFQEFLTGEVLAKDRIRFPITAFLQKLIHKMLSTFLNNDTCFGGGVKHKVRLNKTEALCFNSHDTYDDITYKIATARANALEATGKTKSKNLEPKDVPVVDRLFTAPFPQPILESVGFGSNELTNNAASNTYNYLIFYASRTNSIDAYKGDRREDASRGCHHYSIGRDRGIIKTIKLNRDKRPMLKEARFEAEGYDGLQQLREVYNVEVDCYANFNVFPGAKIYVDGEGWAPTMSPEFLQSLGTFENITELGIGGYYDVVKVEHSFGPGEFSTHFTAYWTNGITTGNNPALSAPSKKEVSKCKTSDDAPKDADDSSTNETSAPVDVAAARSQGLNTPPMTQQLLTTMGVDTESGYGKMLTEKLFNLNGPPSKG